MLNQIFEKYPWLKIVLIVLSIILGIALLAFITNRIWYWNFDTEPKPGKVDSVYWELPLEEYHWQAVSYSGWWDEVPYGGYSESCYDKERTITVEKSDGTREDVTFEDSYCYYLVDEWVLFKTHITSGTDRKPKYTDHGANTIWVKYEEKQGTFTVFFTSEYTKRFSFNYSRQTWDQFRDKQTITIEVNRKGKVPFAPQPPR